MNSRFNLLSLHSPTDSHPRTWICIIGRKLEKTVKSLEKEILVKHKLTRESLSRELSIKLRCSIGVVKQILHGRNGSYPIPIILKLLEKSDNKKLYLKKIQNNVEFLKVNSSSAKKIKAEKYLTPTLARILGAFMADGSLSVQFIIASSDIKELAGVTETLSKSRYTYSIGNSSTRNQHYIAIQINKENISILDKLSKLKLKFQHHYNIELTEGYKDNVLAFNSWIREVFSVKPTSFYKKNNAWRTIFSNKILARYLINFFEVTPGPKTYTAHEPTCIKNSSFKTRKAFGQGVMMFDGCVTKSGKMTFSSKSNLLYKSISEIWQIDKIKYWGGLNGRKEWVISTTQNNKITRFFDYFEKNTQKNKLLDWILGNIESKPIIKDNPSFISTIEIIKILNKVQSCDVNFLEKTFKKSYTSIRYYLRILKNQKKILVSRIPNVITNYINNNTSVMLKKDTHELIFKKIRDKFIKDNNFTCIIQVNKGTFSAWRKRKNRIPISVLKEICKLIDFNFDIIQHQIENTDRDIIELY